MKYDMEYLHTKYTHTYIQNIYKYNSRHTIYINTHYIYSLTKRLNTIVFFPDVYLKQQRRQQQQLRPNVVEAHLLHKHGGERQLVFERAGAAGADCERGEDHEADPAPQRQDLQGGQGDDAGMRVGVHRLRDRRGVRQVPQGAPQDGERGRRLLGHGVAGVRRLRASVEEVFGEV